MPRTTTIPARQSTEEIQSYEHQIGTRVRVVIGTGALVAGTFQFDVPQNMDVIEIAGTDYTALMAAHPTFQPADLWTLIDTIRSKRNAAGIAAAAAAAAAVVAL